MTKCRRWRARLPCTGGTTAWPPTCCRCPTSSCCPSSWRSRTPASSTSSTSSAPTPVTYIRRALSSEYRERNTHTHTHTHPFNGPLSGTTLVSRYQKGKNYLDFTEARDSECQWHQLGHMQVCTSLQTQITTPAPHRSVFTRAFQFAIRIDSIRYANRFDRFVF